ncbi:flavin reductase family protein [Brucella thiophenivorans]|uniref:Flavin reductase like domain protein n=1 Tax=Brucella thiophenivorans TaxID=571255 RepID=A0A256FFH4_9HYPH|nr:flavin reductase family protein [Brucella thiophenivorans]OYR13406.1 flavin reductase like domain protein [Brucella thiophenivorans]
MASTVTYLRDTRSETSDELTSALVESAELQLAMRLLAAGASVVTAGRGEHRSGATVTSATALSMEPPIIVNINRSASVWPIINRHNHFCLNILSAGQQYVADRFAGKDGIKGIARYDGAEWFELESGALALSGALASVDCAVEDVIERHTHAIIIGSALKIVSRGGEPLVYHNGGYRSLGF